jgi:AraC family transcriptional regulator
MWEIQLEAPPTVVAIGRNAHGFEPTDSYCLPDLWSLHLFGYDAVLRQGDQESVVRPGSLGITPPGVTMTTRYFGISVHIYAHFRVSPGRSRTVPAVCDTSDQYESLHSDLYDAVRRFAREPHYANAVVWNTLWKSISWGGLSDEGARADHRAVQRVAEMIEQNLNGRMVVGELAEEAGVSASYLARLFQEAYGESVVGFIRRRRMERASDLLRHSTLPVKLVASSVGFSDLQQFNKAVRGHFGISPRALRVSA